MNIPAKNKTHQLDCARQVVRLLFERTGLSKILTATPMVIVGAGNWISFTVREILSMERLLGLIGPCGKPTFVPDVFGPGRVRSRTSPSLHLTIGSGRNLVGHVDAHYWARNPLGHLIEFLRRTTAVPADLLGRLVPRYSVALSPSGIRL